MRRVSSIYDQIGTYGNQMAEVPAAKLNLEFVLGNKMMVDTVNGNRKYFEVAVGRPRNNGGASL